MSFWAAVVEPEYQKVGIVKPVVEIRYRETHSRKTYDRNKTRFRHNVLSHQNVWRDAVVFREICRRFHRLLGQQGYLFCRNGCTGTANGSARRPLNSLRTDVLEKSRFGSFSILSAEENRCDVLLPILMKSHSFA